MNPLTIEEAQRLHAQIMGNDFGLPTIVWVAFGLLLIIVVAYMFRRLRFDQQDRALRHQAYALQAQQATLSAIDAEGRIRYRDKCENRMDEAAARRAAQADDEAYLPPDLAELTVVPDA
ncbi:MAG: hypothetical protein H8D78_07695 [Chloroflexi bacterium]|nr:hypothetical protein [Chloroflexota bacterium]